MIKPHLGQVRTDFLHRDRAPVGRKVYLEWFGNAEQDNIGRVAPPEAAMGKYLNKTAQQAFEFGESKPVGGKPGANRPPRGKGPGAWI